MTRRLFALLAALALAFPILAADTKFTLDGDNTKIEFVGTKPGGRHVGGFKKLTGTATVADNDPATAKFEVEIDMTSTWTDTEKLTNHLKSPDFFDAKTNPKSKFVSTKVEKTGDGYTVTGDLTLNGKTKPISFPAKMALADGTLTLTSEFKIKRQDYGITYQKSPVDSDVTLKLAVKAKK
jgi:polyisoprenoid-binding protein YceI